PRWSPDGRSIAFLRKVGGVAQIAVLPASGGEAQVISAIELGVEAFEWSPDGNHLAAVGVTWTDEWADVPVEDREKMPRRLTSVPYRYDNRGWTHDRRRHIWIVAADGSECRCLTPGDFDEQAPSWSPDGSTIVALTDRGAGRGLEPGTDVIEIDVDSGGISAAVSRGHWVSAAYSPAGSLHLLGDETLEWPTISTVWRREEDGRLESLTGHLDRAS